MQHAPGRSAPLSSDRDAAAAERDALLDAASDAVMFIDAQGRIEVFNRAAERLFGYTASEVLGQNMNALLPQTALESVNGSEVAAIRKDGSRFPARVSLTRIRDSRAERFVALVHGMDSQHVERSHMLYDRLTRVSRLASMGQMASAVAHEVNQPLTAIASYAQACDWMLARGTTDMDEIRGALREIAAQGLRAGEIIRRLRSMVRQQEADPVPTDANELVEEIRTLAAIDARMKGAQLRFELGADLPPVLADRVRIQQVLLNLVHNSLDALQDVTPESRNVTLQTCRTATGDVTIRVQDCGPGVDPKILDRLFDPFLTTRPSGSGLGLAVSRSIVEAHKGTLRYERPENGGASFVLTLPGVHG